MSDSIRALAQKLHFVITTDNSCRTFGPRKNSSFCPDDGSEIFVGGIPPYVLEDKIYYLFYKAGVIFKIRMFLNLNGTNKGYCFVEFKTPEFAQAATKLFNGFNFLGNRIYVDISTNHCNLLLTGTEASQDSILEQIKSKVNDSKLVIRQIEFDSYLLMFSKHKFAQLTLKNFVPRQHLLWGVNASIRWQSSEAVSRRLRAKEAFQHRNVTALPIDIRTTASARKSTPDSGLSSDGSSQNSSPQFAASHPTIADLVKHTSKFNSVQDMRSTAGTAACLGTANMGLLPTLPSNLQVPPPGFPLQVPQLQPRAYHSNGSTQFYSNSAYTQNLPKETQLMLDMKMIIEKMLRVYDELYAENNSNEAAYLMKVIVELKKKDEAAAAVEGATAVQNNTVPLFDLWNSPTVGDFNFHI